MSKIIKEAKKTKEQKLYEILTTMSPEINGDTTLVCETECTMSRIRSYSDFLYSIRVKPIQTLCYYGAAVFFLLLLAALWCSEWLLAVIFGVIFIVLATLPHNMRISYFNHTADAQEKSYNKVINAEFGENAVTVTTTDIIETAQMVDDKGEPIARKSRLPRDESTTVVKTIPYKNIIQAVECSHSFYIFPTDENRAKLDTIICDKTEFLSGTPMELRDKLVRKCGKKFRIKSKKG